MTPKDPAAGPPSGRAARATVPGRPSSVIPVTEEGAASSPQPRERLAAGGPYPGTGEADPAAGNRLPASPGRVRASDPAGEGRRRAAGTSPAGSTGQAFTITLPAGMELLNANDRDSHWARRKRITRALREAAGWAARAQHIPPLTRARITAVYEPPDRRRRDAPNWYPSFKAAIDGLVDAKVLVDDSDRYVTALEMKCGERCPRGRIVLHLTEVAAATGSDAA